MSQTVIRDPADPSRVVGHAPVATPSEVDSVVTAAARAQPGWAGLPVEYRAGLLRKAAEVIEAMRDLLEVLISQETGKVRAESKLELSRFLARMRATAELTDCLADMEYPAPPRRSILTWKPLGVVALIVPWNWPLSTLAAKLPQALLAGNAVVIKPAPSAPLAVMRVVETLATVLAPGVVNVVTGPVTPTGEALVRHRGIRKVDFTGGAESGKAVMAAAAHNLTRLTLELGGNDPAIVLADAAVNRDLLARLHFAAFATTGQVCMAVKRLYVHSSRLSEVVDGLTELLAKAQVGPADRPESTMGPLHSASQHRLVSDLLNAARASGATVHQPAQAPEGPGHFLAPCLVTGIDQDAALVQCEQFGPALPVLGFSSEDEAIALANDSEYGLCSSIWTADPDHGLSLARRLQAGVTSINHHGPAAQDDRLPFGGVKHSGFGRQLGAYGIQEFTATHVLTVCHPCD